VVVLGLAKMTIAVFLGGSALTLLDALPVAVLGIMLVIAGLELVGTGVGMLVECIQKEKDMTQARIEASGNADRLAVNSGEILRKNTLIAMVTAGVIVALQQTHYGAISGWVVHMVYGDGCQQFLCWLKKWRSRRRSENQ
jgi:xanthine/uracil permease